MEIIWEPSDRSQPVMHNFFQQLSRHKNQSYK